MTPPPEPPVLTDGTVTLRALDDSDVAGVLEQCVDPLSIQWTQVPVPFGLSDAVAFVHEIAPGAWADGSQWIFAVDAPLEHGRYVGNVALRDEGHGRAEIAFGAHPAGRGTGFMEAGLRLLLEWGFGTVGLQSVIWRADVGNWASRKLAWRLGFSLDGVLRHSQWSHGRLVDAWVGTLLADDQREPSGRWFTVPTIETGGLRLRAFTPADAPRVVEACTDPRTRRWLGTLPSPYTLESALAYVESRTEGLATGRSVAWAVTEADVVVGSVNVFDVSDHDAEIGYWTHPSARGRGVMRTAVAAVTSWSFAELGLRRVRASAAVGNTASRHVIESCGFTPTGHERLGTVTGEGLEDLALYDVLAEEWSPGRADVDPR